MAIALVQDGVIDSDINAGATLSAIFSGNVSAGSLIVGCFVVADTGIDVASFSDGTNNGTQAAAGFDASGSRYEIWAIPNHPGGEDTFTVTWDSAAGTFRGIAIIEVSGAAASSPQEGSAAASGNGTNASSGNISPTPSEDGALIVVHGFFNTDTPTWAGSFQTVPGITRDGQTAQLLGYLIQPTAGAIAADWTQTSGLWAAQAASFLPAAGGGGMTLGPMFGG